MLISALTCCRCCRDMRCCRRPAALLRSG